MAIIYEDEDLNTTNNGEHQYTGWDTDELKDEVEGIGEAGEPTDDDPNTSESWGFGEEEPLDECGKNCDEEDISMEVSDTELLDGDIGTDDDSYSDVGDVTDECDNPAANKMSEDFIIDEEFDPDSMFMFTEEEKQDKDNDDDDEDSSEDDSNTEDDSEDDDDDDSSDNDEDSEDDDSEDDDDDDSSSKKSSKKKTNESYYFYEDGDLTMSDDDLEGRKDMSSDYSDDADKVTIDELDDEVEGVAEGWGFGESENDENLQEEENDDSELNQESWGYGEDAACGKGSLIQPESYDTGDVDSAYWKNQTVNWEGDNGADGIPDPDYFEGEGGTANPNFHDDGEVDMIDTRPALPGVAGPIQGRAPTEESYGFILNGGLCLSEENVNIISSRGKYFVTEDDLSMLSNYHGNLLSANTLLKLLAESNGIPLKDLYVYHATDHILVEAKKAATMNKKSKKAAMKNRIKAINKQIKGKSAAKKPSKKLKSEKKALEDLAK